MNAKASVLVLMLLLLSNYTSITNKDKQVETDSLVVGDWTNCKEEYSDGSAILRNVCLGLQFNKDYSGFVKVGKGIVGKFTWSIESGNLIFKNGPKTKHQLYVDGLYKVTQQPAKINKSIILYNITYKIKYYLDR